MAQKWEYLNKEYVADNEWGKLGEQGWELVTTQNGAGNTIGYIFKRPKDEKFPEITDTQRQRWAKESTNQDFGDLDLADVYG